MRSPDLLLTGLALLTFGSDPGHAEDWEWTPLTSPLPRGLSGSAVVDQPW